MCPLYILIVLSTSSPMDIATEQTELIELADRSRTIDQIMSPTQSHTIDQSMPPTQAQIIEQDTSTTLGAMTVSKKKNCVEKFFSDLADSIVFGFIKLVFILMPDGNLY